jgi:hypothetical protein
MTLRRLLLIATFLGLARPALAADDENVLSDVEVHAFVSQGFIKSIRNNYIVDQSKRGSFDLTEVGINFTKAVTDRLRLGVQFFGGGFVTGGAYNAKTDWFYLDYHWRDWLGVRAGRVKLPFGLYNEINDVDAARLPVLLPQSTYPVANRNFLLAQTGFELYGYFNLQEAGALEYRLYAGTIKFDPTLSNAAPYTIRSLDFAYVAGGRLMYEAPIEGLRIGGSVQALRIDADVVGNNNNAAATGTLRLPAVLWMASLEYSAHDWLFAAEYGRWHTKIESTIAIIPPASWTANERYYALLAYRPLHLLQVGSYYAGYFPDTRNRTGREHQQHDVAGTIRLDITPNWLIKLEAHYMKGTAGIAGDLNALPNSNLSSRWAVFLFKTTAYF